MYVEFTGAMAFVYHTNANLIAVLNTDSDPLILMIS
jgi:hypothetical protein